MPEAGKDQPVGAFATGVIPETTQSAWIGLVVKSRSIVMPASKFVAVV